MSEREQRPWGWFEVLHEEDRLKIKRILVRPKQRLSLQSHTRRAENWTVIQGQAVVCLDDGTHRLEAPQMIHIPRGSRHRIENPADRDLIFIEIQTGTYLGEDDITRYEDDYERV